MVYWKRFIFLLKECLESLVDIFSILFYFITIIGQSIIYIILFPMVLVLSVIEWIFSPIYFIATGRKYYDEFYGILDAFFKFPDTDSIKFKIHKND